MGVFADKLLYCFVNGRNTAGTAYHKNLVNFACAETGIGKSLLCGDNGTLNKGCSKLVEFGTGKSDIKMLGSRSIGCDEGKIDVACCYA